MLVKLDAGAQLHVMPYRYLKEMNRKLEKCSVIIKSIGGFQIKSLGKVKVTVKKKIMKLKLTLKWLNTMIYLH